MKTSWILSVYFLFIVGCAPTYIQPSFEDSNQYFLEKTINQLDLVKELDGIISPKYNIALLSIENNLTLDKPIVAMIEDQIISSLIEEGYTIVERDTDVLQNIIREGDKKYSLIFRSLLKIAAVLILSRVLWNPESILLKHNSILQEH